MLNPSRTADRPAAAETAYQHTKRHILTGGLPAGTMLSEGEIAGQLGLSRTPVREAFLRLETEGWLRLYPKRGALVVPVAPGEAEAVVEAVRYPPRGRRGARHAGIRKRTWAGCFR